MKTISNLSTNPQCVNDGKPCLKFGALAGLHGRNLRKTFTAQGLLIHKDGVDSVVLIPESELDALAIAHEPLFAPKPVDNSVKKATT